MKKSIIKFFIIALLLLAAISIDLYRGSMGKYSVAEALVCTILPSHDYAYAYYGNEEGYSPEKCIPYGDSDEGHTWLCTTMLGKCG